jgi:hypothetical protein
MFSFLWVPKLSPASAISLSHQQLTTTELPWSESESESELLYVWRFTANQFVLAPSPFEFHDQRLFFSNSTLAVVVLINVLFDDRMGLSLMRLLACPAYNISARTAYRTPFLYCNSIFLRDGMTYSTVTPAAIGTDCAENTIPVFDHGPLPSNGRLLWLHKSCFQRIFHSIYKYNPRAEVG